MPEYSVGGEQLGNTADRREALAVILRCVKGSKSDHEGTFDLSPDVLYVYWRRPDGTQASAEVSSFYVNITK